MHYNRRCGIAGYSAPLYKNGARMADSSPECSIVIPVFNKWDMTRNCLESLREHSAGHDFEIIVVDNGSTDATATELVPLGSALWGQRFTPLIFRENRNFGPACNAGARIATAPLLFFLNNDTLMTPGWAPPLLKEIRHEGTGAVGPLLLYENNTVQHLSAAMGVLGPTHLYHRFPASHPVVRKKRIPQILTAAALMMTKALFLRCGCFHEGYQNGFEDVELCVRIGQQGERLRYVPGSVIYHLESQTPGRSDKETANGILLFERCGNDLYIDLHHHALRDGFSVFITDLLTVGTRLTPEEEKNLTARAEGRDFGGWLEIARENPFWIRGKEVLAQSLEAAGRWTHATQFRTELVDIEPTAQRCRDLLAHVQYYPEPPAWMEVVTKYLEMVVMFQKDRNSCRKKITEIRRRFKSGADAFLEQAYENKLREMFPE